MAFPQDVLSTKVEIWYDQAWQNITSDVRGVGAEDGEIEIDPRGQPDETSGLCVTQAQLALNNRDGKYSPRNFVSPLYGKIGMNTPIRIITDVADTSNVEDDFSVDGTNGWPNADSGHVWTSSGGAAADFLTSGGLAYHRHTAVDTGHESYLLALESTDFDCVVQGISMEALPTGEEVVVFLRARISNGGADFVQAFFRFFPSGSLTLSLEHSVDGVSTITNGPLVEPDSDETVSLRFRAVGRQVYARAWLTSDDEPSIWDITGEVPVITPGSIMLGSVLRPGVTNALPFDVTYQGFSANLGIILFTGEVTEWPKRWEKTGNDVWVPLSASGLTRRLSQGDKPIGSPLYRHYKRLGDMVGYWSFENLEGASDAYPFIASDLVDGASLVGTNIYPGGDADIKWSGESTLAGSDPLPNVELGASTFAAMQYGQCNFLPSSSDNDSFSLEFWNYVPLRDDIADSSCSVNFVINVANGNPVTTYQFFVSQVTTAGVQSATLSMYAFTADFTIIASVVDVPFDYVQGWRHFHMAVTDTIGVGTMRAYVDGESIDFDTWANFNTGQPSEFNPIAGISVAVSATSVPNAVGHFAVASGADGNDLLTYLSSTVEIGHTAYAGEMAAARLTRLFDEEGITFELDEGGSLTDPDPGTALGPQKSAPFMDLVQAAARADDGVLFEMREDFGYRYRTRWALYGRENVLELDYANADLSEVPESTDDDQRLRNKIIVKREGGSGSVTAEQTTGPLSTRDPRDPIPGAGLYDDEYTASLYEDDQRQDYAAWRKYLGTWDESRFPGVSVALHRTQFAGDHTKMASAALLDIAEILTIVNPPVWLPPDSVVLQVRSVKIFLSNFNWGIEWSCLPGRPWQEVATATAEYGRADTVSSELVSTVDDNDTELVVYTEETNLPWTDPLWTEDINELNILGAEGIDFRLNPATLAGGLGGERVRAAATVIMSDEFGRSGQLSGSNADTGQTWVNSAGTAANITTDGTRAILMHPADNTLWHQTLPSGLSDVSDMCIECDVSFSIATATVGSFFATLVLRQTDLSNFFGIVMELQAGATDTVFYMRKVIAGVATNIQAWRVPRAGGASTVHRLKVETRNGDYRMKVWDPATETEGDWTRELLNGARELLTGNDIAIRSSRAPGNTNANVAAYFENLRVSTGAITPMVYDRFTRTVVNGLGDTTTGETWTLWGSGGGDPNDYDVAPNRASIVVPDVNNAFRGAYLAGTDLRNCAVSYTWECPITAGSAYRPGLIALRMQGTATFILWTMSQSSAEVLTGTFINASGVNLGSHVLWGNLPNSTVRMRTKVACYENELMAKVWPPESPEPEHWQVVVTDTDPVVSGHVGWLQSRDLATGVAPTVIMEDFRIDNPQKMTVQRGMDGRSRAWDAGTDVRLWTPARVGR